MNVELVLRWAHILGAIVLVGGTIAMRFAFYSVDANDKVQEYQAEVRRRWSKLVGATVGLLLISGIVNIGLVTANYTIDKSAFPGSAYFLVFGIKFLLALVVFFLSSALAGKSSLAERLRLQEKKWLTVNVALAVTVVLLAGVMKVANRESKQETPQELSTSVSVGSDSDFE